MIDKRQVEKIVDGKFVRCELAELKKDDVFRFFFDTPDSSGNTRYFTNADGNSLCKASSDVYNDPNDDNELCVNFDWLGPGDDNDNFFRALI